MGRGLGASRIDSEGRRGFPWGLVAGGEPTSLDPVGLVSAAEAY